MSLTAQVPIVKRIVQRGSQYCVVTEDGSKTLGCHGSRDEALNQLRAVEANKIDVGSGFPIAKSDDAQCLVYGYGSVSITKSGQLLKDLQKDIITPEELEKGAYDFVLDFRDSDEMHNGTSVGRLVESMVFTPDKLKVFATDSEGKVDEEVLKVLKSALPPRWWVGFKLQPEAYAKVKSGEYKMFSVGGSAERISVE